MASTIPEPLTNGLFHDSSTPANGVAHEATCVPKPPGLNNQFAFTPRKLRVITIGAGFSGLLMAHKFQHRFPEMQSYVDHTIFEGRKELGGTWVSKGGLIPRFDPLLIHCTSPFSSSTPTRVFNVTCLLTYMWVSCSHSPKVADNVRHSRLIPTRSGHGSTPAVPRSKTTSSAQRRNGTLTATYSLTTGCEKRDGLKNEANGG